MRSDLVTDGDLHVQAVDALASDADWPESRLFVPARPRWPMPHAVSPAFSGERRTISRPCRTEGVPDPGTAARAFGPSFSVEKAEVERKRRSIDVLPLPVANRRLPGETAA